MSFACEEMIQKTKGNVLEAEQVLLNFSPLKRLGQTIQAGIPTYTAHTHHTPTHSLPLQVVWDEASIVGLYVTIVT